jgi:predicted short-subunit dehydrogenase-like oxidoreductase (DUF2520 family)
VGRVLAMRLSERGYPVLGVISRNRFRAEKVGQAAGAMVFSDRLGDLPSSTRLVVICVPDDELANVAEELARVGHAWKETVVMHTSGAQTADLLAPIAGCGATTLSFHPLQTFTATSPSSSFDDVFIGVEGSTKAVAAGIELAVNLGARFLVLTADVKARYHLAASLASNYLVTLVAMAQEILGSLEVDRQTAHAMLEPLLVGTLANLGRLSPEDALTGPIVRGDLETIRQHGVALRRFQPHLVPVYAALAGESVRVAVRSSRLAPDQAEEVLDLLQKLVTLPIPVRVKAC